MPTYIWEGRTRTGELRSGEMTAEAPKEVTDRLRQQQIIASKVKKKAAQFNLRLPGAGGVPRRTLVIFTRQFATMIDAGLPLVQCLDILASQEPHRGFQGVLYDVKASVESGSTFADALKRHPRVFDDLFVNLVAAGEVGGILDTILNRLAVYIEKAAKLRRKIRGAFTYPVAIFFISLLVVFVLLWKVIPTFKNMFEDMGQTNLPGPTQAVVDMSEWFLGNWYFVIGGLVGLFVLVSYAVRTNAGRELFDKGILKMPLFGTLVRKAAVARFTRTLGTMLSSGVPILDALEIVARSAGNRTIEKSIRYTRDRISEGRNMAEPLQETGIFPPMVVQMIAVGESTGAMDTMLNKIAEFYEEEVEVAVENLTSLLEPLMMVFIGGLVGGLMIAMYLPIFSVAETAQGA
jgi:type IV pilus assembly protein PilC